MVPNMFPEAGDVNLVDEIYVSKIHIKRPFWNFTVSFQSVSTMYFSQRFEPEDVLVS